jgi:sterol desaturase/sphingolipid hydroxylase (fatty acid hydroxylase superfamily)
MIIATFIFLGAERLIPGRQLPQSPGWYTRALAINLIQLAITLGAGRFWPIVFGNNSLVELRSMSSPPSQGFIAWFVGTFAFYWWHRLRHQRGWWEVFHQVHHSPSRIEVLTSFYKHPVEIATNTLLSAVIIYGVLGCSIAGAFWYNFFAAVGEYFYHANLRTPRWLRYIVQTPELHSIHHQYDLHWYNFGDIPLWDRVFGTFRDTSDFSPRCGFPAGAEDRLVEMLAFRDVYRQKSV